MFLNLKYRKCILIYLPLMLNHLLLYNYYYLIISIFNIKLNNCLFCVNEFKIIIYNKA